MKYYNNDPSWDSLQPVQLESVCFLQIYLVQQSENKHIINYLNYFNLSVLLVIFTSMFLGCSGLKFQKDFEGQHFFFKV